MLNTLSKKKQNLLIFLCWLVYTSAYLGRYSYNANKILIADFFSVTTAETGLVSSFFFFAYGAGQIINGILCKFYPKKYVLSGALIISSVINLVIAFDVPFAYYKYLWLLNGVFQSVLWTSLMLILSENLDKENLGKAVFLMGTTVAVGTFLVYGISALFATIPDFHPVFIIGAVVMSVVAVVWFVFHDKVTLSKTALLANKQRTKELNAALAEDNGKKQPIDIADANVCTVEAKTKKKKTVSASIVVFFIIMCTFAVVCKLIMDGLQEWTPNVMQEAFGLPDSLSILFTLFLPLIGIFASSICLFLRRYIKNIIFLGGLFFLVATAFIGITIWTLDISWVPVIISMAIASLFTHSINGLITSIAPLYLRDKVNSGTSAGIVNFFCYVGSTICGYGLGSIANSGWNTMFMLLLILAGVGAVLGIVYYVVGRLAGKSKKEEI